MKVLRVKISCRECGQKGFIDFDFRATLKILVLLVFGQADVTTAYKSI